MSRFDDTNLVGTKWTTGKSGLDKATDCQIGVDFQHHEIHEGDSFSVCDYALSQASAAVIAFIITTPNTTRWSHMLFRCYSSAGATIEVHHTPTGVVGGTALTPLNNNRNSATAATLAFLKDPTSITSYGTRMEGFVASGAKASGHLERPDEWVLKQNTVYSVKITSLGNTNDISWEFKWYEHTNNN